jgi:hypothetical protein
MGSRTWKMISSLLLVLPAAAWSQTPGPQGLAPQARSALVESSPKGAVFRSGGQTYQVVGGLRATGGRGSPDERLSSVGAVAADLVEEKGPFLIYKAASAASGAKVSATAMAVNRTQTFPVVVNTRTGRLGVAANVLIVKLTTVGQAAVLAEASGLTLDFVAERLGIAFYTVPDGRDIQAAAAAMAKDARVKSAEVEVREHFAVPM